jgi:hypothetical protein
MTGKTRGKLQKRDPAAEGVLPVHVLSFSYQFLKKAPHEKSF